jgi:hypothetical protein
MKASKVRIAAIGESILTGAGRREPHQLLTNSHDPVIMTATVYFSP